MLCCAITLAFYLCFRALCVLQGAHYLNTTMDQIFALKNSCHDGRSLFKSRHRSTATGHGANQQNCKLAVFFCLLLITCMVVPRDQSSFGVGCIHRAKRLFLTEKSSALDTLRYLSFPLLSLQVVQCKDCFGVGECVCSHTAFCTAGPFSRQGP